ncbi:DASH complex subunit dad4 domain-containing protein [Sarocladium implicatum]|nr:DASH complex subunit dad4 domain-containing protein [Sarocladium implicatum]
MVRSLIAVREDEEGQGCVMNEGQSNATVYGYVPYHWRRPFLPPHTAPIDAITGRVAVSSNTSTSGIAESLQQARWRVLTSTSRTFCCPESSPTSCEKLNEAVVVMNKSLQEINIQNMNVELVAQMFKNYQSNVLFHLEGMLIPFTQFTPVSKKKLLRIVSDE